MMKPSLLNRTLLILALALPLSTLTLLAQVSKNITVGHFNQISVANGIDVYLSQGNTESVSVSAHPDLLKELAIAVKGSNLEVKLKRDFNWSRLFKDQNIKVYVHYKELYGITASGGSDVYTQNTMKTDRLSATVSGGSDLKLSIATKELQVTASGGADADLKGSATNVSFTASGGSDIEALGLQTEYAKVTASGGSDVDISVSKAIEASASGGSDIKYRGDAALKKTSSSNSGDVKRVK